MLSLKYPKFVLLFFTFLVAYFIFLERNFLLFHDFLFSLGYFGVFFVGVFFSYGFTAGPATALLLILAQEQNIFLVGFIAGFGALIGDLLIFKFIRYSFDDEIKKLSKERLIKSFNRGIPKLVKKYIILVFAGFIIASPLPDEIGVSLLAAFSSFSIRFFLLFSYVLNTAGIFVILFIGTSI
ncbi:MAG TPA: hypothetical protein VJB89_00160 [Candidatus Nanoarchaeia archaeon]|nr:hypothetical protein [Candidatus Nanoarchaeia archaeon]